MTQHPAILTTEEAAAALRVHPETLRRWARAGKVDSQSLPGGTYRFRAEVIDALIGARNGAA